MIFVEEVFLVFLFFGISVFVDFFGDYLILLMLAEDDREMLYSPNDLGMNFSLYWLN